MLRGLSKKFRNRLLLVVSLITALLVIMFASISAAHTGPQGVLQNQDIDTGRVANYNGGAFVLGQSQMINNSHESENEDHPTTEVEDQSRPAEETENKSSQPLPPMPPPVEVMPEPVQTDPPVIIYPTPKPYPSCGGCGSGLHAKGIACPMLDSASTPAIACVVE